MILSYEVNYRESSLYATSTYYANVISYRQPTDDCNNVYEPEYILAAELLESV